MQIPTNIDKLTASLQVEQERRKNWVYAGAYGPVGVIMSNCTKRFEFYSKYIEDDTERELGGTHKATIVKSTAVIPTSTFPTQQQAKDWLMHEGVMVILVDPDRTQVHELYDKLLPNHKSIDSLAGLKEVLCGKNVKIVDRRENSTGAAYQLGDTIPENVDEGMRSFLEAMNGVGK